MRASKTKFRTFVYSCTNAKRYRFRRCCMDQAILEIGRFILAR